ncbi:histidine triad (HIT) protein [Moraxella macacae 0408225]|uniref:Histidine triad (HIT) protein n=1 Tax=Moraxella macacae 0408225 TaxID=1230338 RepID=L2F7X0_9GAMM|nr:HIT domain-containing protein [Moraxella macacae]ELA08548.1 histidine triad (HIT) protein [Moraxella macacae 0408225]
MFNLHPQLAKDTFLVGEFPLSTCRLMNDCQFPWLILIPRVAGAKELYELTASDQAQFLRESSWLSSQLAKTFQADKMNIAALGNQVPQLHFHHIVRYHNDSAWPNPVWGMPAIPYTSQVLSHMQQTLMIALRGHRDMPFDWQMNV